VDEFKNVNDTLGHQAGDRLLEALAERLVGVLRAQDVVAHRRDGPGHLVARLGGDEFIILLPGVQAPTAAAVVAERILDRLREPFLLNHQRFFVGASIGITVFPNDGDNVADLVKHADLAMYHAKRAGKNTFQFFSPEMNAAAVHRMQMERRLRRALERDEFVLHFQPIVDLRTGRLAGAEALLRWQDPETGRLVPPDDFIPVAEASGLILPIGDWVLQAAAAVAKAWPSHGAPPPRVSVNASALQVEQGGLAGKVAATLAGTGLEPSRLEIELTETVVMSSVAEVQAELRQLQALGVTVALDDFGIGYSSLSYLRRFSIDKLKIDRGFVRGCVSDTSQRSIVSAIIAMAHALDLRVVAEGIESEGERAFLCAEGCDLGQGYLFSRPVPAAEFARMLDPADVARA
jgi:diguanylate cyclase (GGDEF)-like protein